MTTVKNTGFSTAHENLSLLSDKKISAAELLEQSISRIETYDHQINAVVVRDFDRAREAAKAADIALAKGESKPLLGLPITVKESFNIAGLSTSWGSEQFKTWIPNFSSLVIERLQHAGAIIIGKTNVPTMLQDWQSFNNLYGTTNNPWNINVTPGGSSGGSAAALAAGYVSLELGSDLAGSLRVPAHFCGVYAHKPTLNLIPMRGAQPPTFPSLPFTSDLSVIGPMARSAQDLKLALQIMAGPDTEHEGKGYNLSLPKPRHQQLKDFRILLIEEHPNCPTSIEISKTLAEFSEKIISTGATVTHYKKDMPSLGEIMRIFLLLMSARSSVSHPDEFYSQMIKNAADIESDDLNFISLYTRGTVMSHREWLFLTRLTNELSYEWRKLYKQFDIIVCPIMPITAFPHDHSDPFQRQIHIDGNPHHYAQLYIWSSIATLFGLPSTAMPVSIASNGLPVGLQIIGDYLEDLTTIEFARLYESEFGGFSVPALFS